MANAFASWSAEDVKRHNERVSKRHDVAGALPRYKDTAKDAIAALPKGNTNTPGGIKQRAKSAYTPEQVIAWCKQYGLPEPVFELKFHPVRKWRMDIAWLGFFGIPASARKNRVALEVQGGIFINGGHNRGAQLMKEWDKYHAAQALGWKLAWTTPKDLFTEKTANIIKELL